MKKYFYVLLLSLTIHGVYAQNEVIYDRLQVLINNGIIFYNVDGYTISSQTLNYSFDEKGLKKSYRKYSIKKKDIKTKNDSIKYNHFYVSKDDILTDKLTQNDSYYFVENKNKRITIIQISSMNKKDKAFERLMVDLILEYKIPKKCYTSTKIDSINFAGRKIRLGSNCYWRNINDVQCPYNGEMNWSVHKNLKSAQNAVEQQLLVTKTRNYGKVISEEFVDILFEGNTTKAKKIIFDIKGLASLAVGMSGAESLTIYYVATEVRGNYVSCIMSFWNNDDITQSGLVALLDSVMRLK